MLTLSKQNAFIKYTICNKQEREEPKKKEEENYLKYPRLYLDNKYEEYHYLLPLSYLSYPLLKF